MILFPFLNALSGNLRAVLGFRLRFNDSFDMLSCQVPRLTLVSRLRGQIGQDQHDKHEYNCGYRYGTADAAMLNKRADGTGANHEEQEHLQDRSPAGSKQFHEVEGGEDLAHLFARPFSQSFTGLLTFGQRNFRHVPTLH